MNPVRSRHCDRGAESKRALAQSLAFMLGRLLLCNDPPVRKPAAYLVQECDIPDHEVLVVLF